MASLFRSYTMSAVPRLRPLLVIVYMSTISITKIQNFKDHVGQAPVIVDSSGLELAKLCEEFLQETFENRCTTRDDRYVFIEN